MIPTNMVQLTANLGLILIRIYCEWNNFELGYIPLKGSWFGNGPSVKYLTLLSIYIKYCNLYSLYVYIQYFESSILSVLCIKYSNSSLYMHCKFSIWIQINHIYIYNMYYLIHIFLDSIFYGSITESFSDNLTYHLVHQSLKAKSKQYDIYVFMA